MISSEDEQMRSAIRGDREALTALLEENAANVRQSLAGQMPKRWQSLLSIDDVVQQTYTDAFLGISRFVARGEGAFAAWLRKLAKRNLLDAVKMLEAEKRGGARRKIEAMVGDESFVALYDLVSAAITTPSGRAAKDEAKTALEQAIEHLPDTYRKLVRMYDIEGRPVQEVAEALDRSPGAVYMLRARAHRQLQELLGTASKYLSAGG